MQLEFSLSASPTSGFYTLDASDYSVCKCFTRLAWTRNSIKLWVQFVEILFPSLVYDGTEKNRQNHSISCDQKRTVGNPLVMLMCRSFFQYLVDSSESTSQVYNPSLLRQNGCIKNIYFDNLVCYSLLCSSKYHLDTPLTLVYANWLLSLHVSFLAVKALSKTGDWWK